MEIVHEKRLAVVWHVGGEGIGPFLVCVAGGEEPLPCSQAVRLDAGCGGESFEVGFVDEEHFR